LAGKNVLAVMASLAKQERLRHLERIHAGISRARQCGTKSGRPIGRARIDPNVENAIRASLASGNGILKTARELKVGSGTVQRVKAAMVKLG
jgi:DNA invertase Pin-like site-specific DNA recombinase